MYYYKVFGLTINSPLSFIWPLEPIWSPNVVSCEILRVHSSINERKWNLFYTSPLIDPKTSQPKIRIFSSAQGIFLSYPDSSHFEIQPDKIAYESCPVFDQHMFEAQLFRTVLVLWLELIGMPVLHASGIVIKDSAIGFLANSATGKSTLAAAFVRSGAKFLTDDIFPVEAQIHGYRACPSYAWLRLLPEAARALGYNIEANNDIAPEKFAVRLDKNYGIFCSDPVPLATLYLPVRRDDINEVSIETLSSKQAFLGILQHSFLGKWLVKSPWHACHLDFFANLIKEVPIKQLLYPSGYECLPAVVDAVNKDLNL